MLSDAELRARPALALVTDAECPACSAELDAELFHLSWLFAELHRQPDTLAELQASRGFCPRHTRLAIARAPRARGLLVVYRSIVGEVCRSLPQTDAGRAPCPACTARETALRGAINTLLAQLGDSSFRRAYAQHGGLCLEHVRWALGVAAGARHADTLANTLVGRFDRAETARASRAALGPLDADALVRRCLRVPSPASSSSLPAVETPTECCAVCRGAAAAEGRILGELLAGSAHGRRFAPSVVTTCRRHLDDLEALHGDREAPYVRAAAKYWTVEVAGTVRRFQRTSHSARRTKRSVRDGTLTTLPAPPCLVCRDVEAAEQHQVKLAGDRARTLGAADGIPPCYRHATLLATARDQGHRVPGVLLHSLLDELRAAEDRSRVVPGPSATRQGLEVCLRAAAALDGAVLAGAADVAAAMTCLRGH